MAETFIPRPDLEALAWMQAFSEGISANPALYQLSSLDAGTIGGAVGTFSTALSVSNSPSTKTPGSVAAKDMSRAAAEAVCRQYAILIKYNAGIPPQDKIDIGVRPVNPNREPSHCPGTAPIIAVIASTPGAQTLRYVDSMTPTSRAKPPGASELLLFRAIGTAAATTPEQATFYGKYTKNPVGVLFDGADNAKIATYFARWCGVRGDVGPFSAPVSLAIAA